MIAVFCPLLELIAVIGYGLYLNALAFFYLFTDLVLLVVGV